MVVPLVSVTFDWCSHYP
uniref:Uncharacterized protein n=1 Tax=Anguilla anguilla TaxID=7936 RepID=A0A0E9XBW8_ANGAN